MCSITGAKVGILAEGTKTYTVEPPLYGQSGFRGCP